MKKIKCEWLDNMVYMLRYYDNNMTGLKSGLEYRCKKEFKSKAEREQTAKILYDIWGNTEGTNGLVKKHIQQIAKENINYLLPFEIHRCMLVLTFPYVVEMIKVIGGYAERNAFFAPEEIIGEVICNKDYERENVELLFHTLLEIGVIKKLSKTRYKAQQWPVFEVLGLRAVLLTACALGENVLESKKSFLRLLSFEITHDLVDSYEEIDYAQLVGNDLWYQFLKSEAKYSLQYKDGEFIISGEPFIYGGINCCKEQIFSSSFQKTINAIDKK